MVEGDHHDEHPLQGIVKEVSSQSPILKGVRIVSDGDNGLHS